MCSSVWQSESASLPCWPAASPSARSPGRRGHQGCYDNSGYVKVIDSAATCNAGSTPISWNQKGPKGDGSVHRGVFDKAATYSVGDVVYDPATSYNVCGTVAKDRPAGSYVKIKAGTDKWQQGDPATSSIYSPCIASGQAADALLLPPEAVA